MINTQCMTIMATGSRRSSGQGGLVALAWYGQLEIG